MCCSMVMVLCDENAYKHFSYVLNITCPPAVYQHNHKILVLSPLCEWYSFLIGFLRES